MDPINILAGINIIALFGANISGAKKGIRTSVTQIKEKPKSYLQTLPPGLATVILLAAIAGVFQLGTLKYTSELQTLRLTGLFIYIIFSWFQIWSYKTLGENYAQDVVILKQHQLVEKGPYKFIRHPHYLGQIFSDLGITLALLSYVTGVFFLIEIPFLFLRAAFEEKLMEKHFKEKFAAYRKKTGSFIPFVG